LLHVGTRLPGTRFAETMMVGDDPETDGTGAQRLGTRFIHMPGGRLPATGGTAVTKAQAWSA
jgi:ribonucleotide monophosphatase NagD (HAD superfamily)